MISDKCTFSPTVSGKSSAQILVMHATCPTNKPDTGRTILVVEDEGATRKLIGLILRQAGYAVLEAGDGETARDIYRGKRGEVDLLLTDVSLPGTSGCELAAVLQESEPALSVLFMSGMPQPDVTGPFLRKPFGVAELLQRVQVLSSNSHRQTS
jgi:DNA-binding response OmpR family regulator